MLIKACKFLFLFFALSSVSCASEKPADVAYEFLNEYYTFKDIHKVKKYLHKDLAVTIDSENRVSKRMWEYSDKIVNSWEKQSFELVDERSNNNEIILIYSIKGVKDGEKSESTVKLWMRKDGELWKVYTIG